MVKNWLFDQEPDVAAITTRQVIEGGLPILHVVHYSDDHSWAFTCGTTDKTQDGRVVSMKEILNIDPTLAEVADLFPGWGAVRNHVGDKWKRFEDSSF